MDMLVSITTRWYKGRFNWIFFFITCSGTIGDMFIIMTKNTWSHRARVVEDRQLEQGIERTELNSHETSMYEMYLGVLLLLCRGFLWHCPCWGLERWPQNLLNYLVNSMPRRGPSILSVLLDDMPFNITWSPWQKFL